jgi:FKBP-type peptidyl-prolyl cis-trans isomerase
MIQRKLTITGIGAVAAGLAAFFATSLCAEQAQPPAPPAAEAAAPVIDPDTSTDADAFRAIGFAVARQNRLNVGFNAQQTAWMAEGFQKGLTGDDQYASFQEDVMRAQMIFQAKMQEAMKAREALAAENEKAGLAYIDSLPGKDKLTKSASGLYYEILAPGNAERKAQKQDKVKVLYKGSLINGTVFDESKEPIEFPVAGVVPGMSEGIQLIGEGGKIRLYIPGNLGYGANPPPGAPIKPGAMLVFDVEILSVIEGRRPPALSGLRPPAGAPGNPPNMTPPPPPPSALRDKLPPAPPTTPPPLPPEALKNRPTTPPPPPPATAAPQSGETK